MSEVKDFLEVVNFYRCFISKCANLNYLLIVLTKGKRGVKRNFCIREKQELSFYKPKSYLTTAPVLYLLKYDQEFQIETNASNMSLKVVFI